MMALYSSSRFVSIKCTLLSSVRTQHSTHANERFASFFLISHIFLLTTSAIINDNDDNGTHARTLLLPFIIGGGGGGRDVHFGLNWIFR
jgi:hypothetical protein